MENTIAHLHSRHYLEVENHLGQHFIISAVWEITRLLFLVFHSVIPRVCSKAVLSVGVVLPSHNVPVMQVSQRSAGNTSAVFHLPLPPEPSYQWMFVRAECKVVDYYMYRCS